MKNNYRKLKWSLMLRTLLGAALALGLGYLIWKLVVDGILQARFPDLMIRFFMFFDMSYDEANLLYGRIFMEHKDLFLAGGFVLLFLLFSYVAMSKITHYLDDIGEEIDNILSDSDIPVTLETELRPISEKLNTLKMTLKRREYAAIESEQRKNDLVVYLAHDLKTPLTSTIAYLTMLDEQPDMNSEERAKYTHIALEKSTRLGELINEFFEITRFNLQDIVLEKGKVNLSIMLEQLADESYAVLADKKLTCSIHTDDGLIVFGDPDKLARVFDNLLRNAIAYSYPGTNIDIQEYCEMNTIVITFTNQGDQIPQQKLTSIFEKFYRADNARSSQTGGAGPGLSIAKEIVELHGGDDRGRQQLQQYKVYGTPAEASGSPGTKEKEEYKAGIVRDRQGVNHDREEDKEKRTAGDIVRLVILIAALGVFCYSGYQLLSIYIEYKKGEDEYSSLEEQYAHNAFDAEPEISEVDGEPVMKSPVDFASLTKMNADIIGWLKIEALGISYPVAQGKDNDYYLHNTFQDTPNIAGCIFLDYENKKDFTDRNSLVYGHNMRNGTMFGKLKKFRDEGVFGKSRYFWIYTPEKIYKYEIFACHEVGYTSKTYQLEFKNDQDFMDYIKEAFQNSVVQSDASVSAKDKIVTLSTCTGNEATRFIVQGKQIETYTTMK